MLFAWMGDDVEAILLVFAVTVAFVAIVVVLDRNRRGLERKSSGVFPPPPPPADKAITAGDALHHAQLPTSLSLAPAVSGSVRWVLEGLDLRLLLRISERGTEHGKERAPLADHQHLSGGANG